jgi:hypothetical protein
LQQDIQFWWAFPNQNRTILNEDIILAKQAVVKMFGMEKAKEIFEWTVALAAFSVACNTNVIPEIDPETYRVKITNKEDALEATMLMLRADTFYLNLLVTVIAQGLIHGNEVQ